MPMRITLPLTRETAKTLRAGDECLLSGTLYTARDAAHKCLCELAAEGKELPFPIENATIYYVGPTPAKEGAVIGSAGPTTALRMDEYSPTLLALGATGMIGKGRRGEKVTEAIRRYGTVYFAAIGGCGVLLGSCIKSTEVIACEDLGTEAIRRMEVVDFPVTVVIDCLGNDLYDIGPEAYLKSLQVE